ncbi:MAG: AsmA family protein [Deltaproteobacteria bacterium]|nr:AsmA family protein [Deltaproteobacteria bacterium]
MRRRRLVLISIVVILAVVAVIELAEEALTFEGRHVEAELSALIGLDLRIRGDIHVELLPRLALAATDVVIANAPGRSSPHLARIGRVEFGLTLWKVFRGIYEIRYAYLTDVDVHLEADAEGTVVPLPERLDASAAPTDDPIEVRIGRIEIENAHVSFRSAGSDAVTSVEIAELGIRDKDGGMVLWAEGQLDGSPFDLDGEFGPLAELLQPTAPYPVALRGKLLGAELEARGTLASPRELSGVDVTVSGRLPELSSLAPDARRRIPSMGGLTLTAHLSDAGGVLGVERFVAQTIHRSPVQLRLTGSVRDAIEFRGVELELSIEADDPSVLRMFFELDLPETGRLEATAHMSDDDGSLGVSGEAQIAQADRVKLVVRGEYDDLSKITELDLRGRLEARDLRALGAALDLDVPLPPVGPVVASARLRDRDGALLLDEIDIDIGDPESAWIRVDGQIRDVLAFQGVELEAEFGGADLRHAAAYLNRPPPKIGTFEGRGRLTDADGALGLERFEVRGGTEEILDVHIRGTLDDLAGWNEMEVDAQLHAKSLKLLGDLFDVDLPDLGPLEFSGRLQGSDERLASKGSLRVNQSRLEGDWTASFAGGDRPRIKARLQSSYLHLPDVGISPGGWAEPPKPAADLRAAAGDSLFSALRELDLDLVLDADRVTGLSDLEIRDAHAEVDLEDGELEVRNFTTTTDQGETRAYVLVDASTPRPRLELRAVVRNMDLTQTLSQLEKQPESAGTLDLLAHLRTRGASKDEMLRNLDGSFQAMLREGSLATRWSQMFVHNFFNVAFRLPRREGAAPVQCALVELLIDDGVARIERVLLQGTEVSVTGTGTIDLGRDELDVILTPHVSDPALVSVAATVEVTGPLADPRYRPTPRSLARTLARGMISNVLRPTQPLVSRFRKSEEKEEPSVCVQLLATRSRTAPEWFSPK